MPFTPEQKQWFDENDLWVQAHRRRDELKADGMKPYKACRQVIRELYRPGGDSKAPTPVVVTVASEGPTVPLESCNGDSKPGVVVDPVKQPSDSDQTEKPPGPVFPKWNGRTNPPAETVDDSELMSKDQAFSNRDTSMLKSVKWVASVLGVKGLVPDDAPSPQAWSLYLTYRDQDMWQKFWSDFGKAMMPSKADIENKDRMTDDGREVLSLLDRLEREHDAAVAQAGVVGV